MIDGWDFLVFRLLLGSHVLRLCAQVRHELDLEGPAPERQGSVAIDNEIIEIRIINHCYPSFKAIVMCGHLSVSSLPSSFVPS